MSKEQWIIEAERSARDLAEQMFEDITSEADYLCVDKEWYLNKVIQYIRNIKE